MNFRFLTDRPNFLLFIAGTLAVLALPPVNVLPLMFLSVGWLALQIANAKTARQAFWRGWWWASGYFIFGWYWISYALRFEWPKFAWLLPLSILALPCVMAIYIGLMGAGIHWVAKKFQNKKRVAIFVFPIFFTAFELLRGHLFTGFPWNIIGSSLVAYAPLLQTASVIGIYGLGFLISVSVCVWLITNEISKFKNVIRGAIIAVWALMAAFGFWRMQQPQADAHNINVRIVQPDTAQDGRWTNARRREIFNKLTRLTASVGPMPNLIVWPEAAMPFILAREPVAREYIAQSMPPGALLATGSIRRDNAAHQLYNSIEYVNSHGEILGHYDKFHLVPFGEYMPLSDIIPMPKAVAETFGSLGRGAGPQTQTIQGLRISPMICYEAIFPGEVTDNGNPQLLLNVTDDVWYDNTSGPYQHLAAAQSRAVEEGLPLVRAANNGVSAVIDRFGRITGRIPYDAEGILDEQVSVADNPVRPPGANGMFLAYLLMAALAYLAAGALILRPKINPK